MDKYDTIWRRVWALVLDGILIMIANWLILILLMSTPPMFRIIFSGVISAGYYILMHNAYGQTVGKMAAQIKVLSRAETPINLGQSISRSLPQLIPVMFAVSFSTADNAIISTQGWFVTIYEFTFLFYAVDAIVCLIFQKRRALHDFIAGTVVVRTDV